MDKRDIIIAGVFNLIFVFSASGLMLAVSITDNLSLQYLTTDAVNLQWMKFVLGFAGFTVFVGHVPALLECYSGRTRKLLVVVTTAIAFILEAVFMGVTAAGTLQQFPAFIDNELGPRMAIYNSDTTAKKEWDIFQSYGECCGLDSYVDWERLPGSAIPLSCCKTNTWCFPSLNNIYTVGCREILKGDFRKEMTILWIVTIFAMCLHGFVGLTFIVARVFEYYWSIQPNVFTEPALQFSDQPIAIICIAHYEDQTN